MKNNIMKAVYALPFWIPFPFIFLAIDYYLTDERSWVAISVAVFLGTLSFGYIAMGKVGEMFAGDIVGYLISVIITSILNDGYDESWFSPLTSISYIFVLYIVILIAQNLVIFIFKFCKKIKNKNDGKTQGKLKTSKLFLWLNKGTKTQVFIKKLFAVAALFGSFYGVGYGVGALLKLMGF